MVSLLLLVTLSYGPEPISENLDYPYVEVILRKHCIVCHSEKLREEVELSGGIVLDSYAAILKPKGTSLVVVGKPKESLLYQVLIREDAEKRMPKDCPPLSSADVQRVHNWINSGAKEGDPQQRFSASSSETKTVARRLLKVVLPVADRNTELSLQVPRPEPVTALAFGDNGTLAFSAGSSVCFLNTQAVPVLKRVVAFPATDLRFAAGQGWWLAGASADGGGQYRLLNAEGDLADGNSYYRREVVQQYLPGSIVSRKNYAIGSRICWVYRGGKEEVQTYDGHSDTVLALVGTDQFLFSGSKDRTIRKLDRATGKALLTLSGHRDEVHALALSPDGKLLLSGGPEPGLFFWNTETGERTRVQAGAGSVTAIAISPDGGTAATAGPDGNLRLWRLPGGNQARSVPLGSPLLCLSFSHDGKQLAVGGHDGIVRIVEVATGRLCVSILPHPTEERGWIAWTPAGFFAREKAASWPLTVRVGGEVIPWEKAQIKLEQPDEVKRSLATAPPSRRPTPTRPGGRP